MKLSSAVVETEIVDLRDVSLSALASDQDSAVILSRIAGESALPNESFSKAFSSSLPDRS